MEPAPSPPPTPKLATALIVLLLVAAIAVPVALATIAGRAPPRDPAHPPTGAELWRDYYCVSCHGDDGSGPRYDVRPIGRSGDLQKIKTWIRDPAAVKPDANMPKVAIRDEQDVETLARFVIELGKRQPPK